MAARLIPSNLASLFAEPANAIAVCLFMLNILTEHLNNNTLGKVPRQMLSCDVKIASMLSKRLTDQGVLMKQEIIYAIITIVTFAYIGILLAWRG